jgi:ATP-binding cassette subfamily B protein
VTLSGGQKQRLVIARTIISKAPILVFDDSLSAVDTETDMNIRAALKHRQEQSTTLIITHRVATAKDADKIVVLDQGKIAEIGTHDQLIKQSGLYKRIFEIQTRMV